MIVPEKRLKRNFNAAKQELTLTQISEILVNEDWDIQPDAFDSDGGLKRLLSDLGFSGAESLTDSELLSLRGKVTFIRLERSKRKPS